MRVRAPGAADDGEVGERHEAVGVARLGWWCRGGVPSPEAICTVTGTPARASGVAEGILELKHGLRDRAARPKRRSRRGCVDEASLAATAVVVNVTTFSGSAVATAVVP